MFYTELFDKIATKEPSTDFIIFKVDSTGLSMVGLIVLIVFCIILVAMKMVKKNK